MSDAITFSDAERHFHEADDAFGRHLEQRFADRSVHVVREADRSGTWFLGDQPLSYARKANARILVPGSYGGMPAEPPEPGETFATVDAFKPEFTDREPYLATMDEQGVECALAMPVHAFNVTWDIRHDVEAAYANIRAFNRYLEDDWGYAYQQRIFATPLMALFDVDQARQELERVIAQGARTILLNTGPVFGHSPADVMFDPFWAVANEAHLSVVFHIDHFGYHEFYGGAWGECAEPTSEAEVSAFQWLACVGQRPMMDTMASLVLHNLFGRFPNLHVISVSNGSAWVKDLQRLDRSTSPSYPWPRAEAEWWPGGRLSAPPSEIIREHLYVAPFVQDSMQDIETYVDPSRILMATDYPHPDGFADARDYGTILKGLSEDDVRLITRDNLRRLLF